LVPEGLWRDAYEQLQKEDEKLIKGYEEALLQNWQPGDDALKNDGDHNTRLCGIVKRRLQEIEDSRLKLTVAGKEIVVKDQARRAIEAILSVKDLVTTAVTSEPHAALAWAGILLLLNPIVRSTTQDQDAVHGFERISCLLARYRVVEAARIQEYCRVSDTTQASLLEKLGASIKNQTVQLYAAILKFQIRLAKHFSRSGVFRFLEDLRVADDWKVMLQNIADLDKCITEDLRALSDHTLQDIETLLNGLQDQMRLSLNVVVEARDEAKVCELNTSRSTAILTCYKVCEAGTTSQ
jgi:hypothetical protein